MRVIKFGDWNRARKALQTLSTKIRPAYMVQFKEDGDFILEKIRGHIANQDLDWTPLSEVTVQLKNGDTTIYVETGYLRDHMKVHKVKSSKNGVTFFIGASAWESTPKGIKLSDLMICLEFGTSKIPARPLMRPTYEEVVDVLKSNWTKLLEELIKSL